MARILARGRCIARCGWHDLLLEEARQLGIMPLKDPLDGIEEDIRRARVFRDL